MSKFRYLLVGAGAALALAGAGVLASVGAISLTNSDSHGDTVASAARTTCPHGPNGVHGHCVSAIASSKSEQETESATSDACKAADVNEDSSEKASINQRPGALRVDTPLATLLSRRSAGLGGYLRFKAKFRQG